MSARPDAPATRGAPDGEIVSAGGRPGRLAVPTCIGCGAMRLAGTCETGCSERRRDLVRADACDWADGLADRARGRADALRPPAEAIAGAADESPGGEAEAEAAFRGLQEQARRALRRHPDTDAANADLSEPPEAATTWWCDGCGGLDAPRDCLGICVWRPVEWVDAAVYEQARRNARAERERERRLRAVLRQAAHVHPRPGGWAAYRRALRAQAGRALREPPTPPVPAPAPPRPPAAARRGPPAPPPAASPR